MESPDKQAAGKKTVISKEIAEKEVEKWLDAKKVSQSKRENLESVVKIISDGFQDGHLILTEDNKIEHTLIWPIKSEQDTTKLVYRPRITSKQVRQHMTKVKAGDQDGRLNAHVCALTGETTAIVNALDTSTDLGIAHAIATFFLT